MGHTPLGGAPKTELQTDLAATGDRESRGPEKSRGRSLSQVGPSRILFQARLASCAVVSAADVRIGARFVLGRARTPHAAVRGAAQTIDHCLPDLPDGARIGLGAAPSQGARSVRARPSRMGCAWPNLACTRT